MSSSRLPLYLAALVVIATGWSLPGYCAEDDRKAYDEANRLFLTGDVSGAVFALVPLGERKYQPAMELLAYILDYAEEDEQSFAWYMKLAELNNPVGMFNVGRMYAVGDGVKQNDKEALRWYVQAARHRNELALVALSKAYATGQFGLQRDEAKARQFLEVAVQAGSHHAMGMYAELFESGAWGLPKNPQMAAMWRQRALEAAAKLSK